MRRAPQTGGAEKTDRQAGERFTMVQRSAFNAHSGPAGAAQRTVGERSMVTKGLVTARRSGPQRMRSHQARCRVVGEGTELGLGLGELPAGDGHGFTVLVIGPNG